MASSRARAAHASDASARASSVVPSGKRGSRRIGEPATCVFAAEDQNHDAVLNILADTGQNDGFNLKAGLILYLMQEARGDVFGQVRHSAQRFPMAVVARLGEQYASLVIGDHACHADRVRVMVLQQPASAMRKTVVHVCTSRGVGQCPNRSLCRAWTRGVTGPSSTSAPITRIR